MIFNSLEFLLFLPIVFVIYWFFNSKSLRLSNIIIIGASYVFYGWWDYRFLSLIILSSAIDFLLGKEIFKTEKKKTRKHLLWLSIGINLGFLGFFKYFNFFIQNFIDAFHQVGIELSVHTISIVLPVGISFYTFQTLSYTIDVYRQKIPATKDPFAFFAFVSFFPQLVAGPIERASNLLPQFYTKRNFNYLAATDGLRQILWGLFKKVVIADNCAEYVNIIFNNYQDAPGSTLLFGSILFAFQIYGDFSGYSDIAIGTSRLFGFKLKQNFAFPYFSRDIAEFWRRWHISLSTWFRDYLYIPLGGSRGSKLNKIRNTFVIFVVSGFWHGANWTFIFWGLINAIYFLPLFLSKKNRNNIEIIGLNGSIPILEIFKLVINFLLVCIAWVFFRSENLSQAFKYLKGMFSLDLFSIPFITDLETGAPMFPTKLSLLLVIFISIEWHSRRDLYGLEKAGLKWNKYVRYLLYYTIIISLFWFGGKSEQFIYFQF